MLGWDASAVRCLIVAVEMRWMISLAAQVMDRPEVRTAVPSAKHRPRSDVQGFRTGTRLHLF